MWYFFLVLAVVCAVLVAMLWATKARGVWGSRRSTKTVEAGAGPYRMQQTAGEEPLPTPRTIWLTATLSAVWGALTTFLFAPAGALLLIVFGEGPADVAKTLGAAALVAIVASGLGVGITSMTAAFALMQRSESVDGMTRMLSRWSLGHHCAVPMFFAAASLATGEAGVFAWNIPFVWVPCAIGLWHAWLLERAHALTAEPAPAPA